ncbi:preprotein translocase subunit SecG [Pontibacillus litoralis]|uniref:Protein-export membrane protein SecG n=1 Tax=Pontibacillus litoralis JSM 072002 TaxID=1385512 RepID=A0A0A5FUG9_9BACI|nr:preprotein translocase subunit SecG [Pontibacillus litoralis]KGX84421.1 preprotein translocase subunit SecG [Pontibacillus litoralis JSM 072002]
MYTFAIVLLVIDALALITLVLLQSGKSAGLAGSISGGAEELFGKQKARGMDAFFHKATVVTAVLLFVLTFLIGYVLD